ncbi:uncharacterized protein ARMOST_21466 [Armillaria ostoyae]|uniref:Uncharacterized protein n=1 Tax=Armillaria ostoyae TaxID=47428 RepID=A0A284SA85_ARMOS|nr:uncharacterized protein ARMOST_21466 [Armillaria ostoyae]
MSWGLSARTLSIPALPVGGSSRAVTGKARCAHEVRWRRIVNANSSCQRVLPTGSTGHSLRSLVLPCYHLNSTPFTTTGSPEKQMLPESYCARFYTLNQTNSSNFGFGKPWFVPCWGQSLCPVPHLLCIISSSHHSGYPHSFVSIDLSSFTSLLMQVTQSAELKLIEFNACYPKTTFLFDFG